jgi:hypothetical protein
MITLRGGDFYVKRTVIERQSVAREVGGTGRPTLREGPGCALLSRWLWNDRRAKAPSGEVKSKGTCATVALVGSMVG